MSENGKWMRKIAVVVVAGFVALGGLLVFPQESKAAGEIWLRAGMQDDMKTRNLMKSNDVWTSNVIGQLYDGVLQFDPNSLQPQPYILLGTEQNGVAGLQAEERGQFNFLPASMHDTIGTKAAANRHDIIAYYDFKDVLFHDGEQATIKDVLFTYHLVALHPNWYTGVSVLMDEATLTGNFSTTNWLFVWDVSDQYSSDGNDLTSALRFHLEDNYANLWMDTMATSIFPMHVFEGTGKVKKPDGSYKTGIHDDFGRAIDDVGKGVPTTSTNPKPLDFTKAQDWEPKDSLSASDGVNEVIGTGMWKFQEWDQSKVTSKIVRYDNYKEKLDMTPQVHKPFINGIQYNVYSNIPLATMALKKGDVDILLWSVPPDFISDLSTDPNIAISMNPEPGFFYQAFNMRSPVFGYIDKSNPALGDKGKPLRQAVAHLIDRKTIVDVYLQGNGIIADGPVSPVNTYWYNSSLPKYDFSVKAATDILDANGLIDTDGDGWRDTDLTQAGDQDGQIELLAPTADYDPIRAQACLLIEAKMKEAQLNTYCNHQAFGTIISKIDSRQFQMYILGWAIGGLDPDYLYSFFYSRNGDSGQNYPGYNNPTFDDVILRSRSEMDSKARQDLIRWAQGILAEELPYNVLYYRTNIEAYRADHFTGWTTTARGSLYNGWSLMNIHPPSNKFLRATASVASAISATSGNYEKVTATVRDQNRNVIQGATINISLGDLGFGNLSCGGGVTAKSCEGLSDVNGVLVANYYPGVMDASETSRKVSITVKAAKCPDPNNAETCYDPSDPRSVQITVFPPGTEFMSVTLEFPYGDVVDMSKTTVISVLVKNQAKLEVPDATVALSSLPTDLGIDPSNGTTDSGGKVDKVTITAPSVTNDTPYIVTASPFKTGSTGVNGTAQLLVLYVAEPPPPPVSSTLLIAIAIAVIVVVVVIVVILMLRRGPRRKKKKGKVEEAPAPPPAETEPEPAPPPEPTPEPAPGVPPPETSAEVKPPGEDEGTPPPPSD